jgi:chromatin remodeling complex protein RSC6
MAKTKKIRRKQIEITKRQSPAGVPKSLKLSEQEKKDISIFMQRLNISSDPLPRTDVVKKLWAYIRKHKIKGYSSLQSRKAQSNQNFKRLAAKKSTKKQMVRSSRKTE